MDKSKINIDQYFKTSLQNFEGNAGEGMFDAIKEKVDASNVSKVSVDDFFKGALSGMEVNADDLAFDDIKSKVDASKIKVDDYFREALIDYNSYALPIPFSEIQNKLDRERVIDEHFKNALQNFEGEARDEEFAVIRDKVLQLQARDARKRYAWLLLLLLIPAWFMGSGYFKTTGDRSASNVIENGLSSNSSINNKNISTKRNLNNSLVENNNNGANQTTSNIPTNTHNTYTPNPSSSVPSKANGSSKNNAAQNPNVNASNSLASNNDPAKVSEKEPASSANDTKGNNSTDGSVAGTDGKTEVKAPETVTLGTKPGVTIPGGVKNANIRKHLPKYTVQVSGAASRNSRFLSANDNSKKYLGVRSVSDKVTTKYNFGLDLLRQSGRFSFGFGLNGSQFGQSGTYTLTRTLYDSIPVYGPWPQHILKGYFYLNQRDTIYGCNYNNTFTTLEIPFQFSYRVWDRSKFHFEIGAGMSLSYLAGAKGVLPNASATEVVQISDMMKNINRFGATGTAKMRLNYDLTPRWQLGTEIYLKSSMTSLYKKNTGVKELPYSCGMRWGLGFKF